MGFSRCEYNSPTAFGKYPYSVFKQWNNYAVILVTIGIFHFAELDTTHLLVVNNDIEVRLSFLASGLVFRLSLKLCHKPNLLLCCQVVGYYAGSHHLRHGQTLPRLPSRPLRAVWRS